MKHIISTILTGPFISIFASDLTWCCKIHCTRLVFVSSAKKGLSYCHCTAQFLRKHATKLSNSSVTLSQYEKLQDELDNTRKEVKTANRERDAAIQEKVSF